ncbi:MAG: endonuclease/exonuclease/phosphatase family protein [Candidatus Marinimicrobia bacterium]|nr:endonuclease/exonuclease/phosphatase family protein [Candidatus Neomarinimicrobiota bacterium]
MKFRILKNLILLILIFLIFWSCEPIVTKFEDCEDAVLYTAGNIIEPSSDVDTLLVMTWNIRFGAGRIHWFGDCCGDRVIMTEQEVTKNLEAIADYICQIKPDILLLQEVDIESKRSAYIDQLQWLLDHTYFNYGVYASMWQSQFIPSDGLGRMNMGGAILSRWKITDVERIALSLRGDQDALTQYFYLRRCMIKAKIGLPNHENFYVLDIHAAAFSTDYTKRDQIDCFKEEMDKIVEIPGALLVAGGDLNELPPGSDSTNYCDEDRCSGDDQEECRDGSDFTNEQDWLDDLYASYQPAVPINNYLADNSLYFTYGVVNTTVVTPINPWNRKLDYLFTNGDWVAGSDSTHQSTFELSDHVPVSAKIVVTQ